MAAVRQRDEDALLEIYDRYSPLSYGIILHVLRDESLAEELMQDIFLMLWNRPEVFDPAKGALGAWLTVVSRHRAVDALRRRRAVEVPLDETELPLPGDQDDRTYFAEMMQQVCACLAVLPREHQRVFALAYFDGMSHSEICARTGQPLGTIKSRLRFALSALRRMFEQQAA